VYVRSARLEALDKVVWGNRISCTNPALAASVLALALVSVAPASHRPSPSPVEPGFVIRATTASLTGKCEPSVAARRLIALLDAFNQGRARAFSRGFAYRSTFEPYNDSRLAPGTLGPGRAIEQFVWRRHRRGDSWAATTLVPPVEARGQAIYGLDLKVRVGGRRFTTGAKVVIDCRTGRVPRWVGPTLT
jgi:hypothetical protein